MKISLKRAFIKRDVLILLKLGRRFANKKVKVLKSIILLKRARIYFYYKKFTTH